FLRVKGASSLNKRGLAVLKELCDWRHLEGERLNKPTKAVISDNTILELSRRPPESVADIQRIRGIRPDQVRAFGQAMLTAITRGLKANDSDLPSWPAGRITSKKEVLMADILFAVLKIIAYEVDLATELLSTRDEVQAVVRAHKEGRLQKCDI